MLVASIFAATVLMLSGILVGIRAVGSSRSEVAQAIEPVTAGGKAPAVANKGKPAEADIVFKRPVEVEEVLRIVGEKNRDNFTTMESFFHADGAEISDTFSVSSRLETAGEIESALGQER